MMALTPNPAKESPEPLEAIQERFRRLGVRTLPRPLDPQGRPLDPQLPYDLTAINDVELGRLFGQFCIMAQYAQISLAVRAVETAVKKRADKVARSEARLLTTDGATVGDKEAEVEVSPKVKKSSHELLVNEGTEILVNAVLQGYLIGRDAISREMTRRISMNPSTHSR